MRRPISLLMAVKGIPCIILGSFVLFVRFAVVRRFGLGYVRRYDGVFLALGLRRILLRYDAVKRLYVYGKSGLSALFARLYDELRCSSFFFACFLREILVKIIMPITASATTPIMI